MKSFIITIDTESDNQWDQTNTQTTENAKFIPRFQELCKSFGYKPTYLVDYSMSNDEFLVKYLSGELRKAFCEIGMHLHAWDTPPFHNIDVQTKGRPYLIEYPIDIMEEKIKSITDALENRFETKMLSHRAGRWATNQDYLVLLEKYGYRVDCSVTPGINWAKQVGDVAPGSDYSNEKNAIHRIQNCDSLIEIPMTVERLFRVKIDRDNGFKGVLKTAVKSIVGEIVWLRPSISTLDDMKSLIRRQIKRDVPYLEFMMHSSEFMPNGSPYYKTNDDIENMYHILTELFEFIQSLGYEGYTLSQIHDVYRDELFQ